MNHPSRVSAAARMAGGGVRPLAVFRFRDRAMFVQEGRAGDIQRELRSDRPIYAEVMVTAGGRARVRRLLRADGSVLAD